MSFGKLNFLNQDMLVLFSLQFSLLQNTSTDKPTMNYLDKGQIISECLFDVFKFSKKTMKNLTNFCPGSKKWSNYKIKVPYIVFITLNM